MLSSGPAGDQSDLMALTRTRAASDLSATVSERWERLITWSMPLTISSSASESSIAGEETEIADWAVGGGRTRRTVLLTAGGGGGESLDGVRVGRGIVRTVVQAEVLCDSNGGCLNGLGTV